MVPVGVEGVQLMINIVYKMMVEFWMRLQPLLYVYLSMDKSE